MTAAWVVLFVVVCCVGAAAESVCRASALLPRRPPRSAPLLDEADFEQIETGIEQRDEFAADVEQFLANVFGWPDHLRD